MAILRLSHIGLCVADIERSMHFYRDLLGFQYVSELQVAGEPTDTLLQLKGVDLSAIYLERDGFRLELLYFASPGHCEEATPRPMNRIGLTHLSLRVDNLAQTLETLRAAGAHIVEATRINFPAFEAAAVFITDPDGTLIELMQAPGDPSAAPGT